MAKKKSSKRSRGQSAPLQRNAHAAGIDVGAEIHYVAVESGLDPQPVRSFGALTQDLHVLADWLCKCGVQTVAMESTGVYWIPLFQILEARGLEVCLVNARHVKNVPGRKTDVQDCQWLQYLHSVGLLHASFRPAGEICAVRSLLRHRDGLMRTACLQVQHMQKALDQMNVLLHRAVSDITGVTGLKILDAIAGGERDAVVLASLRDKRCSKSEAQIAKALTGDWRAEHLFTLKQSLHLWRLLQQAILECDKEINHLVAQLADRAQTPLPPPTKSGTQAPPEPQRAQLFAKFGVDLTAVEGVRIKTAQVFLSEVGPDVSRFASAAHFASWLGLSPDNRISGGRKLGTGTRPVKSRLANILRMAVQNYHRSESALGHWFRRLRRACPKNLILGRG
jgi:transposase